MSAIKIAEQMSDQLWRLNNLYKIVNKEGKPVRFKLNSSQEQLYWDLWYRNVILKARQRGFTTFLDIYALDCCLFNRDFSAGIIAHNLEDAKKIFRTKVKYPYEHLPDQLKKTIHPTNDRGNEYIFSNNSSISVSTSYRSGTLQFLHVSEFGKIAAKNPEKATEIITGALEAVPTDGIAAFESTAEGNGGEFYEMVYRAKKKGEEGKKLNNLEFKMFFEPWWKNPEYVLDGDVTITEKDEAYFNKIEALIGQDISEAQRRWYVAKEEVLGSNMKREYPSTPEEAFEVAVEGAYYAEQMSKARKEGRITKIPIEESVDIDTFWDLGRNDKNSIWFMQKVGKEYRFIDYYENSGESLSHYAKYLKKKKLENGYVYGKHYLPHDVKVTDLSSLDNRSRKQILEDSGVKPIVTIERIKDVNEGIELVRSILAYCWFDSERCSEGIKCLDNYKHQWDDKNGVFLSYPQHDWASNGSDAFRQFAQSDLRIKAKRRPINYPKVNVV